MLTPPPPRCLPPCPGSDLAVCLAHTVPLHCPHSGPPTAIPADSILSSYSEELVHPFLLLLFSCPALLQYSYTPGIATQHSEQTKHIQTKDDHTYIHVPLLLVYLVSPPHTHTHTHPPTPHTRRTCILHHTHTHTHTRPHHTHAGHAYYTTHTQDMHITPHTRPHHTHAGHAYYTTHTQDMHTTPHTHTRPHHTHAGHAYYTTSSVLMPNTLSLRPTTSSW